MAAGLGFKDFTTGEVLTAADVDGYLMQGIWVFANATARDAAVTSPQEGNSCYLKDTDVIQVYSGSSWVVKSGGSSPLTTKGDLYTYSTTDTRLASSGVNNDVLTVDTSTATGLKWAAVSGGAKPVLTPQITSYIKPFSTGSIQVMTVNEDWTYYYPVYLPGVAIDRLAVRTGSGFSGTGTMRLGLYNADATTGKPSTVYLDAGTVSVTASSTIYQITVSSTPPAGYYYFAVNAQTLASTHQMNAWTNGTTFYPYFMPVAGALNFTQYYSSFYQTGVTGAFATAGTLNEDDGNIIAWGIRIA